MKQIFAIVPLLLSSFLLQAEWDPEYCLDDPYDVVLQELNDQKFQRLKNDVTTSLKNSWCSNEKVKLLMDLMVLIKPNVCVEIGACTGSSILPVAATLKYLGKGRMYAVDAWSNETAVKNLGADDPNRAWWAKVNMQDIFVMYKSMINTWGLQATCITVRSPSNRALTLIPREIDFLHLDGDYSEVGSTEDVELYLPRVRSGGYILLSNLYTMVNGKPPKLKSYCALFDSCEVIAEIENDNAVLFRKN
jgi:predicted O-methyltransferase YrrM